MSLLDIDLEIEPNLWNYWIDKYLKRYLYHSNISYIDDNVTVKAGFHLLKKLRYPYRLELIQTQYDDHPEKWMLMYDYLNNNIYITEQIESKYKLALHIIEVRCEGNNVTLKDILDEFVG